ncbi:MAG: hypothetical protein LBT29_02435 [Flavobacteriaceae bacterium]|nr:hypothetical protein [Flavobacteriaceae bacterium]
MTHVFSERVSVICDFKFGTITTLRDDNPIDKFSIIENKMSIDDYENFLIGIAESAEQLKTL